MQEGLILDFKDPVTEFLAEEQRQFAQIDGELAIKQESEQSRTWKIEFERRIVEKDEKERKAIELMREEAKKMLSDLHKKKDEELMKIEKTSVTENPKPYTSSSLWERVIELCDIGKNARGNLDRSRMKAVFMSLKNTENTKNGKQ
ncbi:hypothetical protein GJ496_002901 [Pomphorhynchus laevis]|nr:hypothetical protein GJ496_002901 [Pomphorhynchus laevis]